MEARIRLQFQYQHGPTKKTATVVPVSLEGWISFSNFRKKVQLTLRFLIKKKVRLHLLL